MRKAVKELSSSLAALHLTYRCTCRCYEVFAELHPMDKKRHTKTGNKLTLRLRCAECGELKTVYRGSVRERRQFVIRRFPRVRKLSRKQTT